MKRHSSISKHQPQQQQPESSDNEQETPNDDLRADQVISDLSICKLPLPVEVKIPDNLTKFDYNQNSFKFGTVGIYNTHREKAFYKIEANLGGKLLKLNEADWSAVTQTIWRFDHDDF